jgi:hypothetical protein
MSNKKIDKHSTNISFTKNQFKRYKKSKIENLPPTLEAFQKFKYNNPKKWEDMKRQYRLWKYNKPDESVAKIILNPVLTKK